MRIFQQGEFSDYSNISLNESRRKFLKYYIMHLQKQQFLYHINMMNLMTLRVLLFFCRTNIM